MKITIAQLNYHVGNFNFNFDEMASAIKQAVREGSDIICFGELATTAYPPRDFLEFADFIKQAEEVIDRLVALSTEIAIVVGSPTVNPVPEGKDLFNTAYFLADGKILHMQHKTLLPTYDIFDEYRYFEPASDHKIVEYKGYKIALTVCEDIWNLPAGNTEITMENPLYKTVPLDILKKQDPDFIINISASPFNYKHAHCRKEIVSANTKRYGIPMFYINHVGAQTEIIFDGGSLVAGANGNIYDECPYFQKVVKTYDLEDILSSDRAKEQSASKISLIHDGLICGLRNYFGKLGFKKAVIGLSGGIDSAVTTALAAEALGPENVSVLLMPSQYSSDHSVSDAEILAQNLGIRHDIVPIKDIYSAFVDKLNPIFDKKEEDVTEENIQARARGVLLMAISNKHRSIVLNTSNKSEAAVGYGTLYGDMCGGLSVIGDVYKMDVYALARYINRHDEIIPVNSITKPPSAELRPDQKDSDSLPPYEVLDEILELYIEQRKGPQEIIDLGHDAALVKRILRLVNINEFKRFQTAPTLRVSPKAFGMGRRMPIVAKYLS